MIKYNNNLTSPSLFTFYGILQRKILILKHNGCPAQSPFFGYPYIILFKIFCSCILYHIPTLSVFHNVNLTLHTVTSIHSI